MKNTKEKPLILVSNDDGVNAKGINALIESLKELGKLYVVAPDGPRSGQSSAITVNEPLRAKLIKEEENLKIYKCNGTPTDCVKLAINQILPQKPDLVVSGINHGSNASISVLYSGTMGAALEACVHGIPAIGFSLCNLSPKADMNQAMKYAFNISKLVLENGLPENICLNVNIPDVEDIKGIKISHQAKGKWVEEFVKKEDPYGRNYYWLTGSFKNYEPENKNSDDYALKNAYVSVVPCKIDMTDYASIDYLKKWNYE